MADNDIPFVVLYHIVADDWLPRVEMPEGWRAWVEQSNKPLGTDEDRVMTLVAPTKEPQRFCAYTALTVRDYIRWGTHAYEVWRMTLIHAIEEAQEKNAAST